MTKTGVSNRKGFVGFAGQGGPAGLVIDNGMATASDARIGHEFRARAAAAAGMTKGSAHEGPMMNDAPHQPAKAVDAGGASPSDQMRGVLDGVIAFICILTPAGILTEANEPALRTIATGRDQVIGKLLWDCDWWNYDPEVQTRLRAAVATAASGEQIRYESELRVAGDARIILDFQISPHRDAGGSVDFLIASGTDITDRVRHETFVRAGEARFRATFDNAAVGIAHMGLDGRWTLVNRRLCEILGYPEAELLELTFQDVTHADDLATDLGLLRQLLAGEIAEYELEKRYWTKNGTLVWANLTVSTVREPDGTLDYCIKVVEDISDKKAAERQQKLLIGELNHRVKNILATVQAMASHTMRAARSMPAFSEKFSGRLRAIAASHDSVFRQGQLRADLSEVIRLQLAPYAAAERDRLVLSGPPIHLSAACAHALGLIIHEMATNASKYGALSNSTGRISVLWEPITQGDRHMVRLIWQETGGPPVRRPSKSGFGSRLISSTLEHSLRGSSRTEYRSSGLVAEFTFEIADAEDV